MSESAERRICPISGCENKVDPELIIEFTIGGVEGVLRATICKGCHTMISHGYLSSLSLSPVFTPAYERVDFP